MDEMVRKQNILDAIEKCHKRCCRTDSNGDEWIHYETTLNEIEALPSVQPKRKTGYKINQHQYPAKWVCSECGAKHFDFSDNFCSQCGADVRGEQDE